MMDRTNAALRLSTEVVETSEHLTEWCQRYLIYQEKLGFVPYPTGDLSAYPYVTAIECTYERDREEQFLSGEGYLHPGESEFWREYYGPEVRQFWDGHEPEGLFDVHVEGEFADDVPDPPLVGIEPNPGPPFMLYKYLKNIEREQHTPTPKCARVARQSKRQVAAQRLKEKSADVNLQQLRDLKLHPEGFMDFGMDQETKDFIKETLNGFQESIRGGIDLRLDFTQNLSSVVGDFLKKVSSIGGVVYDFVKFVICLIFKCLNENLKEPFAFVCSTILGYSPEGIIDASFLMFLFKGTLAKHMSEYDVLGVIKTLSKMKDTSKETSSSLDYVVSIVRDVAHALNMTFNWSIPTSLVSDPMDDFFNRFYKLRDSFRAQDTTGYNTATALFILQEDVERYYRSTMDNSTKERALYLLNVLRPFVTYMESSVNPNDGPRNEPCAIIVAGPTAVGKSTFTLPILLSIMPAVLALEQQKAFLENHNQFIFYRANENEYWDGYRSSHIVIVFDDFGQRKDVAGGTNPDAFEIIRLKNTAPAHLHYASISEKQRNYAKPALLYATTNRNQLEFKSIISNEAVIRRFDVAVCQVPKPEFCVDGYDTLNPWTRRMDMEKVRAKYPYMPGQCHTYAETDVIEFIEWDFHLGVQKSGARTFTFEEFRSVCIAKCKELNSKGEDMLNYHKLIKSKYSPESALPKVDEEPPEVFHDAREIPMSRFDALFDSIKKTDTTTPPFQILRKILSFVGVVCAGVMAFSKARAWFWQSSTESAHNKSKREVRRAKRDVTRSVRRVMKGMTPQSGIGNYDFHLKLIKRSIYWLTLDGADIGQTFFVRGSTFVIPRHFDDQIEFALSKDDAGPGILEFRSPLTKQICFQYRWVDEMKRWDLGDADCILLKLPRCYREHSDLTKHFPLEKNLAHGNKYASVMFVLRKDMPTMLQTTVGISGDVEYLGYRSSKLCYSAPTTVGDCGAILVTQDTRFSMPTILGIHTSGTTVSFGAKYCAGVNLTQEDLEEAYEFFDESEPLYETMGLESGLHVDGFNALGTKPRFRTATKTKLEHSPLYGQLWPVTTAPAKLTPFKIDGAFIDPVAKARKKYSHVNPVVDMDLLQSVYPFVRDSFLHNYQRPPWHPRVFSFEEAVAGIPGVEYVDGVARGTSPGYPFVLTNKSRGKTAWMGSEGDVDFTSVGMKNLHKMVQGILDDASIGVRREHLFMDCLKDERRPLHKVLSGSTRQIMASPMDLLIACKMMFGDFIRHCCSNKIYNGSAVGIDPVKDWSVLAEHLLDVAGNHTRLTAGDYEAYDAKVPTQIGWMVLDIIEAYYIGSNQLERRIRRVLFHEVINSMHITPDGVTYEFIGGNASGNFMTALYNTICNVFLIYCCVFSARNDAGSTITDAQLVAGFRPVAFGDDNSIAYAPAVAEFVRQSVLTRKMKELFDYTYTDEAKSGVMKEDRLLTETTFLKRGFRETAGVYMAPLELSVVLETLNWTRGRTDLGEFELRIEAVATELAFHGKEVFAQYFPKLQIKVFEIMDYRIKNDNFESAVAGLDTLTFN